jgi:uncharacterized membrane-anchored protein YhcB (DUF1043 family)
MVSEPFWRLRSKVAKNSFPKQPQAFPFPPQPLPPRRKRHYPPPRVISPAIHLLIINPADPTEALRFLEPDEQLHVERIQFASPGFTDLAGLGTIVGHVTDFLFRLIELCTTGKRRQLEDEKRELENEQTELENQKKRIENVRQFVSVARELGYTNADMRPIIRTISDKQAKLLPLIEQGKISGVRVMTQEDVTRG